ncbi:MAG: hypothetical protein RIT25_1144 [Planctomycetota bacterium]
MHFLRVVALLTAAGLRLACAQSAPLTVPERSGHERTSTHAEVVQFLDALGELPHADRLTRRIAGRSTEGRDILVVRAALADQPAPLRMLVIANIHAGEVEGKEAVQALLREFAQGMHEDLLRACEVHFVPVYNADGNERVKVANRAEQNGPVAGVGERANGQGLDLNRDFVKARAPETRALLELMNTIDPHVFMDLHTTNGSFHGYHLTYAPCLSPNMDPGLAALSRRLLEDVRAGMQSSEPSFRTFDYGNFETRDWDGGGAPDSAGKRGWWTYDHRARYCINGFGLRNRIGVLSEAYSYADFATRIAATRTFVLAVQAWAVRNTKAVLDGIAAADALATDATKPLSFGFATTFAPAEQLEVLVGEVDRVPVPGTDLVRLVMKDAHAPTTMPVVRAFRATRAIELPAAWALPAPEAEVVEVLRRHGIRCTVLDAPRTVQAAAFAVTAKRKPKRPFQGHHELVLQGAWQDPGACELPAGTLWIEARQPLARLAATLLEPESEDSLSTWNFLEQRTADRYPVLRVPRAAD